MKIGFDITIDDLVAFNLGISRRYGRYRTMLATQIALCSISCILLIAVADMKNTVMEWIFFGSLAAMVAALGIMAPRIYRRRIRNLYDKLANAPLLAFRTMEFGADGVTIATADSTETTRWSAFIGWEETKDHFFLYLTAMTGGIVPKSKIAAKEAEELRRLFAENVKNDNKN